MKTLSDWRIFRRNQWVSVLLLESPDLSSTLLWSWRRDFPKFKETPHTDNIISLAAL